MKILAISRDLPGARDADFKPHLRAEAAHAYGLYQSGVLREIYFEQNGSSAVIILECASAEEGRAILSGLPLVRAGLIAFDVMALTPYTGFARLFEKETP